jgi:Ran GTPase-activating protein (RanGAP) involved in mRNA processing and transport
MRLLVDALQSISLQRFTLQDCRLQRPAVKTLCQEALQKHSTLRLLDLSYNPDLDDRTSKYLCKLLECNPTIVDLYLKGCSKISRGILMDLSDKLRYNNSFLKTIGFSSDVSLAILDSMQMLKNIGK